MIRQLLHRTVIHSTAHGGSFPRVRKNLADIEKRLTYCLTVLSYRKWFQANDFLPNKLGPVYGPAWHLRLLFYGSPKLFIGRHILVISIISHQILNQYPSSKLVQCHGIEQLENKYESTKRRDKVSCYGCWRLTRFGHCSDWWCHVFFLFNKKYRLQRNHKERVALRSTKNNNIYHGYVPFDFIISFFEHGVISFRSSQLQSDTYSLY